MLVDDGLLTRTSGSWEPTADLSSVPVPATIAALLAARLDRLRPEERAVLECASVVGQVFWRTSVAELTSGGQETDVASHLLELVRRELIRPDRSTFAGDDAYRFRHLLIRDAAYVALPKADRAELHEAFTFWLERVAGERVGEYEAILGYHLEQACRLQAELRPANEADNERGRRAAGWLAKAGRRSRDQGDDRSARGLLERAANVLPLADNVGRSELLFDLGRALWGVGELAAAEAVLSEAVESAAAAEDLSLHGRARLENMRQRMYTGHDMGPAEELALALVPGFSKHGDQRGLAVAHCLLGTVRFSRGQNEDARLSLELASRHALLAGDIGLALQCRQQAYKAGVLGPTPSSQSLDQFRDYTQDAGNRLFHARMEENKAHVVVMRGGVAESRDLLATCRATYQELGLPLEVTGVAESLYWVEMTAGDAGAALDELRTAAQTLEAMGEKGYLATISGMLADALVTKGRNEEAERFTNVAEELATSDDFDAQMRWRRARGVVLARRGEVKRAEGLIRDALDLVADTDGLNDQANTLLDLSQVLRRGPHGRGHGRHRRRHRPLRAQREPGHGRRCAPALAHRTLNEASGTPHADLREQRQRHRREPTR